MTRPVLAATLALLAGCSLSPPAPAPKPAPVVRKTPPDWFQQRLAAARQAQASHLPKDDRAGARAAHDQIVHAACVQVALSGPEKYQARCAAVLNQPPAADPFACDTPSDDPSVLRACND